MTYHRGIILILFLIGAACLAVPAAADTNHITNGDFNSLVDWNINSANTGDYSGSSYQQLSSGGVGGGYNLRMNAWGGATGGYGTGVVSAAQNVGSGDITKISYYWYYTSQTTQGYPYNAELEVYWRGNKISSTALYPSSTVSSWTLVEIPVSSTNPGGELIFSLRVPGTASAQRDFTVYFDNVQALSTGNAPTVTSISASPSSSSSNFLPSPATVTFTASGIVGNPAPQYLWVWGDETSSQTGYDLNSVQHTYAAAGTYTATLYLTNSEGDTSASTTIYVGSPLPTTDFYASPTTGPMPLQVTFILTSYESGETYQWWFGDGNDISGAPDSTQAQPVHTYEGEGTYSVRLKVTNSVGTRTIDKANLVTVDSKYSTNINTGQGSFYSPHSVQMVFVDMVGNQLSGVQVTAAQTGSSSPLSWIYKWFGMANAPDISQTQSGTTGIDGTISWLMYPQVQYTISYTYEGISKIWDIYPQDSQYLIRIDTGGFGGAEMAQTVANFNFSPNKEETDYTLSLEYSNPETTSVTFWVKEDTQNITLFSQTFASQTMKQSYVVPNVRGAAYTWGYTAVLSDGTVIDGERGITMTRGAAPLWDLHLEDFGLGKEWYTYISFLLMMLVAFVFSQSTAKAGAIVIALCLGPLFWFVGWLPWEYGSILSLAAGLAVVGYAAKTIGGAP